MHEPGLLGEGAGTDAGRAVRAVAQGPVAAACLVIQVPGIYSWIIGNIGPLPCAFTCRDGIHRAVFGTFLTHLAKFRYAETDRVIPLQWQISDYFTYADTGTVIWSDQFTISPLFAKSGFNRHGYIECQIID